MKGLGLWTQIAIIILIIGGINWGFVGLFNINPIAAIFGDVLSRIIFVIVGVAACYLIYHIYLDYFRKVA